jgi:hypothetical protein
MKITMVGSGHTLVLRKPKKLKEKKTYQRMKKLLFSLLVLGLLFCLHSPLYGQRGKQVLNIPNKYMTPVEGISLAEDGNRFRGRPWVVYGDREVAVTRSPGGNALDKKVQFGGVYHVLNEKGDYIELVKINSNLGPKGDITPETEFEKMGWVKKDHVLLWNNCLRTDDRAQLYRKVMIINTVNSLRDDNFEHLQSGQVNFYENPDLNRKSARSSGLFQIYFVYKIDQERKAVLLGKSYSFSSQRPGGFIGWVPMNRIVLWDQRVALEPNWEKEAIAERQSTQQKARFFRDRNAAAEFQKGGNGLNQYLIWDDDQLGERRVGDYRRFPVLESGIQDGLVKVGVMGDINAAHGKIEALDMATLTRKVLKAKSERRNFDITFVVDATKSMDIYYPPIVEALKNTMSEISRKGNEDPNSYRFGAVVYRDHAEPKVTEKFPLTANGGAVGTFLEEILSRYDAENRKDLDKREAVYKGLQTALRETGLNPKHTNIVVLIGDVGNHYRNDASQVDPAQLTRALEAFSCNVLAFQAINKAKPGNASETDPAYADFVRQMKDLIKPVAENKFLEMSRDGNLMGVSLGFPIWKEEGNIVRLENGALSGTIISAPRGQRLAEENLTEEIERLIREISAFYDKIYDDVETILTEGEALEAILRQDIPNSGSEYVSSFPAALIYFLHEQNLSPEQLKLITSKSYQMFMEGYAPLQIEGAKNPLFKFDLLLNRRELGDLNAKVEAINISPTATDLREDMKAAWIELIRAHIGNISQREMEEMSIEDITDKVFGIPSRSKLANVQLKDLTDDAVVDDYTLVEFADEVALKLEKLQQIFNATNYEYSFFSNDKTWYWIAQDLLP